MPPLAQSTSTLTDADLRAVRSVADCFIASAGRTTLALALRGSRSQRVLKYGADRAAGYGYFAKVPQEEVLARIDHLISEDILALEYRDGYPLLVYPPHGLELAQRFAAEEWLEVLRSQVAAGQSGRPFELPPVLADIQGRNQNTVLLLVELVRQTADATWLPLLRAWVARETRRVRGRLLPVIAELERITSN